MRYPPGTRMAAGSQGHPPLTRLDYWDPSMSISRITVQDVQGMTANMEHPKSNDSTIVVPKAQ